MLVANAVVDTDQPRLQVGENQMDDRQALLGNLWITTLGNSEVLIAALTEASIAAPIVSNDQRSRRDGALDEPTERLGATVEHDGEPNASGIASVFPVVELGARLSMTHLDGTGDGNLVVNTTAFPTRSPANPGFVHLNMVLGLSTDPRRLAGGRRMSATGRPVNATRHVVLTLLIIKQNPVERPPRAARMRQVQFVGPACLVSLEDGEAGVLAQRRAHAGSHAYSVVEVGATGPIEDQDTILTEVPVRGFWRYYCELTGFEARATENA